MPKRSALKKNVARRSRRAFHLSSGASLGLSTLAFLIILVLFGKLSGSWGSSTYHWDSSSTLNLVVKSDAVYMVSFNPKDQLLTFLKIPDETYLDVPLGFGKWPLRSVYDLGQAEPTPIGAELLQKTVGSSLGVPVDGYLIVADNLEKMVDKARKNPLEVVGLARQGKTNLNFWDALRFWWGVKGVRSNRLQVAELGQSALTSWVLLPDGSRVLSLDQLKLDQFIQERFEDPGLRDEGLSIGIYNTTEHSGLAERAARVINNIGGRVVFTATSFDHLGSSMILGRSSYTTTRLSQIFAPSCLPRSGWPFGLFASNSVCTLKNLSLNITRADIVVVLGEDYFVQYNQR